MRVGVGLPNTVPGADGDLMVKWAMSADAGPFSSVGVYDRLLYDSFEALTLLAAVAVLTPPVRLAATGVHGARREKGAVAKEAAPSYALYCGGRALGGAGGGRLFAAGKKLMWRGARIPCGPIMPSGNHLRSVWPGFW